VPVQQRPEINIPEGLNENLNQGTAPQLEGATDPEDEMLLDGTLHPYVHRTAPPVGPTLVILVMQEGTLQEGHLETIR
jgi:hypothetical protein